LRDEGFCACYDIGVCGLRVETISFDNYVAQQMASLSGHSPVLDFIFLSLGTMNSFKIVPLIAGLFYLWCQGSYKRRLAIVGVGGAFVALVLARFIQNFGSHKLRPLASPQFDFANTLPSIADWSSFPSDTTALACAIATAIGLASPRLGLLAFAWAAFTAMAKLYGGYHFPSDVAAGAMIGAFATYAIHRSGPVVDWVYDRAESARLAQPGLFAFCSFIVAFQLATFFNDIRSGAHIAHERLSYFSHKP